MSTPWFSAGVLVAGIAIATPVQAGPVIDFGGTASGGPVTLFSNGSVRGEAGPYSDLAMGGAPGLHTLQGDGCIVLLGIGPTAGAGCAGAAIVDSGWFGDRTTTDSPFGNGDPVLLGLMGVAPNTPFRLFHSSLLNEGTPESPASIAPLPEPGSMLLLGTGLFGVARIARRRLKVDTK